MTGRQLASPYDSIADLYDALFVENNPYYQAITNCEWEVFNKWVPCASPSQTALDIGCGTGLHTGWLVSRGYDTIGIDTSSEMIRIAVSKTDRQDRRATFLVSDAFDEAAISGKRFAALCCLGSTLNHLTDWQAFAQLASRRLQCGGVFVFSYDNFLGLDTLARILLREYAGYSSHYWRDIVTEKVRAYRRGGPFRNHWRVSRPGHEMEVSLTYERTQKWLAYLNAAGFRLCALSGVHVVDCFGRRSLRASAGLLDRVGPSHATLVPHKASFWARVDKFAAKILPSMASNIVGIAVKK